MDYIRELKSLTGDAFLSLPLLLLGFLFFFGTLTSNVGMLYLFLGHLLIAPALSFLSNQDGPLLFDNSTISLTKPFKWLYSMLVFLNVNASSIESMTKSKLSYLLNLFLFIPGILQFIWREKTPFSFLNPVAWFSNPSPQSTPANCSILPGYSDKDAKYNSPSTWMTHISFFFGFIMSNASHILNYPDPFLSKVPVDEKSRLKQQSSLENRIRNRKFLASSILFISLAAFLLLIFFRSFKTSCESSLLYSAVPIVLSTLTGASWFTLINSKCGIQPADVLGIVHGFIDQSLADNPIVCIGS